MAGEKATLINLLLSPPYTTAASGIKTARLNWFRNVVFHATEGSTALKFRTSYRLVD